MKTNEVSYSISTGFRLFRATMNQKIGAKNSAVQTVLTARVTSVTGANTSEALYEALRAFWDADRGSTYFTIESHANA